MEKEGKNFKPIYGVEAYFIPSLQEWAQTYEEHKASKKRKKDDAGSGFSVEDESETKNNKDKINKRSHLILLAQNQIGLNNIFNLISQSFKPGNFYRFPRIDYDLLKKYNEGVIASSACLGGIYAGNYWANKDNGTDAVLNAMRETTEKMVEVFGDRWYGELQWIDHQDQHQLNQYIIKVCGEYGVELISTSDSHYYSPEVWKDRSLYKRLRPGIGALAGDLPASVEEVGYELYPKNGEQMWESYQRYSHKANIVYDDNIIKDSITRTYDIAHNRIETFYPDNTVRLPSFVVQEGMTADEALSQASRSGLASIDNSLNLPEYGERLERELKIIKDRGFSKYFLTMKAIADKARLSQLSGPARGSAGGSLVAYALGITQVDPIEYDLLFSRFLRSDATDYPDIDYDVSDPMALKAELIKEWGDDCVVPISNWNTLQMRSLIKDIAKFYDVPFIEVNTVTKKMYSETIPLAKKDRGIKAGIYDPTFDELMKYSSSLKDFLEKYPRIKTHVTVLKGQIRSCSRHAGGVVVGENLNKYMPLIYSGGVRQTPWTEGQHVRHLEPMGFIKFDILGLGTLRMIEDAIALILKRHHNITNPQFADIKKYYDKNLHPNILDVGNTEIYKNIFHSGRWAGVFQFTEPGAQKFCQRAQPTSLIDIAAITSIFRPGPLSAGVDKDYIEAKKNPQYIKYLHPIVEEVTQETYGFLIFQEQIAILAHRLGKNITLDEGNLLRKLLTKKGTGKGNDAKVKIHTKFIDGCYEKGITKKDAEKLWQTFEYFSGYGFNKSHAVGYSMLSFQCAWLLNYYPSEWLASFLNKEPDTRKEKALNIAKNMGYKIDEVDINKSGKVWEISKSGKLLQPLTSIKGLGEKAMEQIIANRPFNSMEELLFNEKIAYAKLNKKALDVLVRSGACDSIVDDRFKHCRHLWLSVANNRPKTVKKLMENITEYAPEPDFSHEEKVKNIIELTGLFPFELVLDSKVKERLRYHQVKSISQYDPALKLSWFIPRIIIPKKTKRGKDYWIIDVVDDSSQSTKIKCWGVKPTDEVFVNRPYVAKLDYDETWGFSCRGIFNFKMIG
jgi:DNA polymerase-3 subunit alpha